jgi:NAD(P)H-quinone oxidoreductase subunit 4
MNNIPWLTIIVLFPIMAGFLIPFIPDDKGKTVRWYALGISLLDFIFIIYVFGCKYSFQNEGLQLIDDYAWISKLHLNWSLGVDGISMPLILLTGFITTLATLAAWPVTKNAKLFYFLMLAMYSGQLGVFASQNILLFFFMWELELIPVYILLSLWGGKKRLYASTKFIIYTALGSIFILLAGLAMAFYGNSITFNMIELANKKYPLDLEILAYIGFLIAYGVKLSAFPLHTWLPDTHGEAHYSTCMLLAGVLLKMGGYALIRINMDILPNAHHYFAPLLVIIGVINIIYAALTSFAQRNLKRKIAYSSVSHMGFVLIGLGSLTNSGLSGVMLQMISHGLIGSALFFLAGSTYDRTRTLLLEDLGGIAVQMPKIFAMFTAVSLASLALPGMSGFISELMIFLGFVTSEAYSPIFRGIITLFEAAGIILTPIYLLSALRQVFYGSKTKKLPHIRNLIDAGPREIFVIVCLIIPMIGLGIYPKFLTQIYETRTNAVIEHIKETTSIVVSRSTLWT